MYTLYHYSLCPLSRQIRFLLHDIGSEVNLINEHYWLKRKAFLAYSPMGEVPVLIYNDNIENKKVPSKESYKTNSFFSYNQSVNNTIPQASSNIVSREIKIRGVYSCLEYIIETHRDLYLFPRYDLSLPGDIRNLVYWFNTKFYNDVIQTFLYEKIIKYSLKSGVPSTTELRKAISNLAQYLPYIDSLIEKNGFLIADKVTLADIVGASHISFLDYFNELDWSKYHRIYEWYLVLKSRPGFRGILQDYLPGLSPSPQYGKLDF